MNKTWGPTSAGKLFTSTPEWSLTLDDDKFSLRVNGKSSVEGSVLDITNLEISPGVMWASINFPLGEGKTIGLDGIPNDEAHWMISCFQESIDEANRLIKVRALLRSLKNSLKEAVDWAVAATQQCKEQLRTHGWLTAEFTASLEKTKPTTHLELIAEPEIVQRLREHPEDFQASIRTWARDTTEFTNAINERHTAKVLLDNKEFFDKVEKAPLTAEQSRSVICLDNRVLLVASAGSGKTSTIVAKAAYALQKGYVKPENMLILTFNNAGAEELRVRAGNRLKRLNLPADEIDIKTFHAFGLEVIGLATGKRPSLAPWLDAGEDLHALVEVIEGLKRSDLRFLANWELFRIVLGQDLPAFGKEEESPDHWSSESRTSGFLTANGESVKSRGEMAIANWLFLNGINYQYEAPYKHDTADAHHRQYNPDFYFPEIDVYLEHWALDENGNPPPSFKSYEEGVAWKRELHQIHRTVLLETTMAQLWSGEAFEYLEHELKARKVQFHFDPDRPAKGRKPIDKKRMARTFRSFLTHFKSNRLTISALHDQVKIGRVGQFVFRHHLFIRLFDQIWLAWEAKLKAGKWVDFEDMLNQAADLVETKAFTSPYEMILVDEFQDTSQARARIAAALLREPGRLLFAVGDDWQSINRFAGADLNVMTNFSSHFGRHSTLKLGMTFRCSQGLCDISSRFIQKNPSQIRKAVSSVRNDVSRPVRIVQVRDEYQIRQAVKQRIEEIERECRKKERTATSIFVIGRYQNDRNYCPTDGFMRGMTVEFVTAHSSKGLEADYVILPRVTNDLLGFPSKVSDDPILQLAMPEGDGFELSEERRLFYVALTRARQSVTIITLENRTSPFVHELIKDFSLPLENPDGTALKSRQCVCGKGFLIRRHGKKGEFYGCSSYPVCRQTRQYLDDEPAEQTHRSNAVESQLNPSPNLRHINPVREEVPARKFLDQIQPTSKQAIGTYRLAEGEIDLIGFSVQHKTLGHGKVIAVRQDAAQNFIFIRYSQGNISEYEEARFTGLGDWFYGSYDDAKSAAAAYFKRPREQMVLRDPTPEEPMLSELEERHRAKVGLTDKPYLGVRLTQGGRRSRVARCYSCKAALDNSINLECNACGWILCACGACGCGYSER